VRLFVGNYQVAGRRGTWFSFSIADRPTRWLKEKFERFVSSAAGSLARRKPKCLSNKPITSSKRQDPIFIASTPALRKGDSQVWNSWCLTDGDETKAACYAEFHLDYAIERIDLSDQKNNNFNIKQVFCGKRTNFFFQISDL
jgi:hypothetical protein